LASLLSSGAKLTDQVLLINALDEDADGALSVSAKRIGGPLLFGRIWERLGIAEVLGDLLAERAFEFAVERAIFVTTLHRIFVSGSDRDSSAWMEDYDISGAGGLDLRVGRHRLQVGANDGFMGTNGFVSCVHRKKPKGRAMPEAIRRANAAKSKIRSRVEDVFAEQKDRMGLFIRTVGIARATVKIGLASPAVASLKFARDWRQVESPRETLYIEGMENRQKLEVAS
jgi:hypothetical protein